MIASSRPDAGGRRPEVGPADGGRDPRVEIRHPTSPNRRRGFTLIELLLVVVIIGILAAIVVPRLAGRTLDAQIGAAKAQLSAFRTALGAYEVDNGRYPTSEQGLLALVQRPASAPEPRNWKGPYLDERDLPLDPWGHPYLYLYPGQKNPNSYDLFCAGPDGQPGTEDDIER